MCRAGRTMYSLISKLTLPMPGRPGGIPWTGSQEIERRRLSCAFTSSSSTPDTAAETPKPRRRKSTTPPVKKATPAPKFEEKFQLDVGPTWTSTPRSWVVFSDLHVSSRTLPVCLQVLQTVSRIAREGGHGVIFLGDFWHARGALPVEPLNQVLQELRSWGDLPTLMLVGNHDQTTLGGEVHALEALATVRPTSLHVFSRPAMFNNALWLPYRRSADELRRAIAAATSTQAVDAIFCHADIQGARINDAYQSALGLPKSLFPSGLPVYSGHYHQPHVVPGTSVQYVGSPYQVSRAEAGQQKRLLLLDSRWSVLESIPLDVGPRHMTLRNEASRQFLSQVLASLPSPSNATTSSVDPSLEGQESALVSTRLLATPTVEGATDAVPGGLRPGDRVRVVIEGTASEDERRGVDLLRSHGVNVELLVPPKTAQPRLQIRSSASESASTSNDALLASPSSLFAHYASLRSLSPAAVSEGQAVLQRVAQEASFQTSTDTGKNVVLERVTIEGFGPFATRVDYTALNSGTIRIVTGDNQDDPGAESNGSGKSALVMSPIWCLKGDGEGDLSGRLTRSDVVHDACREARVMTEGRVNGTPFSVDRVTNRTTLKSLRFVLGGKDLTLLDSRQTQALIDEHLAVDLLQMSAFKSQPSVTALLDATDKEFKETVGSVVNLQVWETAREEASGRLRAAKQKRLELDSAARYLEAEVNGLQGRLAAAQSQSAAWSGQHEQRKAAVQQHVTQNAHALATRHDQLIASKRRFAAFLHGVLPWSPEELEGPPCAPSGGQVNQLGLLEGPWNELTDQAEKGSMSMRRSTTLSGIEDATPTGSVKDKRLELVRELQSVQTQRSSQQTAHEAASAALASARSRVIEATARSGAAHGRYQAALAQQTEYKALAPTTAATAPAPDHTHEDGFTCDRCLQPISQDQFLKSLADLEAKARDLLRLADEERLRVREAEDGVRAASAVCVGIETEVERLRKEQATIEAALADLDFILRAEQQKQDEARMAVAQERERLSHAVQQAMMQLRTAWEIEFETGRYLAHLEQKGLLSVETDSDSDSNDMSRGDGARAVDLAMDLGLQGIADEVDRRCFELRSLSDGFIAVQQRVDFDVQQLAALLSERDPSESALQALSTLLHEKTTALTATRTSLNATDESIGTLTDVEKAFSRAGIPSYILESAVLELQDRTNAYLEAISGVFTLELRPFKAKAESGSRRTSKAAGKSSPATEEPQVIEKIDKVIYVQMPNGDRIERSLRQCSGGERRRVALALTLGFRDLVADRAGIRCNVLVLDEVMQLLDAVGTLRVCEVLRALRTGTGPESTDPTVLLVAQANSIPVREFLAIDVVTKVNGSSTVEMG